MGLFNAAQKEQINKIAAKSTEAIKPSAKVSSKGITSELQAMMDAVVEYFKDSESELVTEEDDLACYVDKCIAAGFAGIDTETTGLDRLNDWIVGFSLYCPGEHEIYIPCKHLIPIFDEPYPNQMSYGCAGKQIQRLIDGGVKLVFANADFDIAMIYKDFKVDCIPGFYYDVISAWRCLKENELDNALKTLYAKYVMKGKVDPKKFSDFFTPKLFPYCKPEVAKLYAANDAKITYELMMWQLKYVDKTNPYCKKHHLEKIADLVWNIEFPMVKVCAILHRNGVFMDDSIVPVLHSRYEEKLEDKKNELAELVQSIIDVKDVPNNRNRPFRTGRDFNPNSPLHVSYLIKNLMGIEVKNCDKETLAAINQAVTDKILEVRGAVKLISTYVDKLPNETDKFNRIHASFQSMGAATGRMSSSSPNLQNIPSHATDIRHMFRATPEDTEYIKVEDKFTLSRCDKIEILDKGWTAADKLCIGDIVISDPNVKILDLKLDAGEVRLEVGPVS